ncbi:uncharacterized protein [Apostichopus japonicus]|uniref:uncharacterized protein n=1 Tax=Stichopus japonicus TaxID=307972 RepID=UPI003AB52EA9
MSYLPYPPPVHPLPILVKPPGYDESAGYLRHLLDEIERDIIMPLIIRNHVTVPFKELLKRIVDSYNVNLTTPNERLDFGDSPTRWAYVYVFLMRHSHLVHTALVEMTKFTQNFVSWQYVRTFDVCAIGGGPATDILGFALFLKTLNISSDVQGTVIDKCGEWGDTWTSLHARTSDLNIKNIDYVTYDLTSEGNVPDEVATKIRRAHLVTLTKVVSSLSAFVCKRPAHLRFPFLRAISPGTFVLFIDNESGPHNGLFREAVSYTSGFRVIADFHSDMAFPSVSGPSPNHPLVGWLSFFPAKIGSNRIIFLQKVC